MTESQKNAIKAIVRRVGTDGTWRFSNISLGIWASLKALHEQGIVDLRYVGNREHAASLTPKGKILFSES